jgi:hypothetical protein
MAHVAATTSLIGTSSTPDRFTQSRDQSRHPPARLLGEDLRGLPAVSLSSAGTLARSRVCIRFTASSVGCVWSGGARGVSTRRGDPRQSAHARGASKGARTQRYSGGTHDVAQVSDACHGRRRAPTPQCLAELLKSQCPSTSTFTISMHCRECF